MSLSPSCSRSALLCSRASRFQHHSYNENGNYVPFKLSNGGKGLSGGVIGGISVGIVAALLLLVFCVYVKCYRRKKMWNKKLVAKDSSENFVRQVWLKRLVKVVLVKSIMESSMARYVYGSVSPKINVYAFRVVLYELISVKEALMRSGGASGAELKGLVALVIINDFAMELLQIETQRKDEARREALKVANEERKKLKAEAAQIRAQERKIAQ
ncbi:hypothetical protein Ahy_A04g020766 [Arachis hypogaea]|uniref:Uncharacterized protein n=1 Tax=Arachis hypogaea TaxID=3818 RepID=A0A445DIG9_ARAHY|nr:hypothetical protein Ahy_A04g020766 [Arachis hypogaea]